MRRMIVLYGGKSGEHEVSRISAAGILGHFPRDEYDPIPIGIDRSGVWYLQPPALAQLPFVPGEALPLVEGPRVFAAPGAGLFVESASGIQPLPCDLVFPVLHGTFGEDGTIQGLLETINLPYVGAGVLGSAIGMDKEKAKELWRGAGLPIVDFITVRRTDADNPARLEALLRRAEVRFGWPVFVKPACGGSSVGTSRVDGAEGFAAAVSEALEWDRKALVEPFIQAREIECSVLGNDHPVAFMPGEIIPSHTFYDYEAKYIDPHGAALVIPAGTTAAQSEKVRETAIAAYRACELSGMARVDFFIDRRTGEVLLNEVNTIPGFTHISMYPRMCESGGLPYSRLIARLGDLAIERFQEAKSIRYER